MRRKLLVRATHTTTLQPPRWVSAVGPPAPPSPGPSPSPSSSLSLAGQIGTSIGVGLALCALGTSLVWLYARRRQQKRRDSVTRMPMLTEPLSTDQLPHDSVQARAGD